MRGRKPKPKALKVFEGNRKREDLDYSEPAVTGTPVKPSGLGPIASQCWDDHIGMAITIGAGSVDTNLLRAYCELWETYRQERERYMRDISDKISFAHMRDALMSWHKIGSSLGMSPVDRARFKMPNDKPKSNMEELLA